MVISRVCNELNIWLYLLCINLSVLGFFFCGISDELEVMLLLSCKNFVLLEL